MPGFGAFIASRESASYDETCGRLTPPRRSLSFNADISHNDGLLISSVARRDDMCYDRASDFVSRRVEMMTEHLSRYGELEIAGVGRFVSGSYGATPAFEPSADSTANLAYSALPVIEPVVKTLDDFAKETRGTIIHAPRRHSAVSAVVSIAASIALLLGLGFALTMPQPSSDGNNYASLAPVSHTIAVQPEKTTVTVSSTAHERFLSIAMPADTGAMVKDLSKAGKPYCLVVASLNTRAQAQKFIRNNRDSRLKILVSGPTRYRVYVAEGSTPEAVEAAKTAEIASRYPGAWICER